MITVIPGRCTNRMDSGSDTAGTIKYTSYKIRIYNSFEFSINEVWIGPGSTAVSADR